MTVRCFPATEGGGPVPAVHVGATDRADAPCGSRHVTVPASTKKKEESLTTVPDTVLVSRDPYAPIVIERAGRLLYRIFIESGHASFCRDFPVEPDAVRVLRDDAERYYFLFAALHHPYQLSATNLSDAERARYFSTILFAGRDEVEAFMTELDRASHGALANLLRIFTQADYRQLRAGRWFGMGAGTPAA